MEEGGQNENAELLSLKLYPYTLTIDDYDEISLFPSKLVE